MSVRCRKCEEELDNSNAEIWEHFYSVHIDDIDPRRHSRTSRDRRIDRKNRYKLLLSLVSYLDNALT